MNGLALAAALAFAQAPTTETAAAPAPASRKAEAAPRASVDPATATTIVRRRRAVTPADPLSSTSTSTSTTTTTTPTPTPTPTPTSTSKPLPEREDAERTARAFLDALVHGDADALARAAGERFSFDGDVQAGRDAIRRTWRAALTARAPGPAPAIGAVEVLPAADATARLGKPPARLAPLVRPGVLVAVANVGGRTVVLFLSRENGRMAALGLHD